jgi:hypothetical protein
MWFFKVPRKFKNVFVCYGVCNNILNCGIVGLDMYSYRFAGSFMATVTILMLVFLLMNSPNVRTTAFFLNFDRDVVSNEIKRFIFF